MKTSCLFVAMVAVGLVVGVPESVVAGITPGPSPGTVPEPTALLVWLGLAAAGGLFFWRRGREQ